MIFAHTWNIRWCDIFIIIYRYLQRTFFLFGFKYLKGLQKEPQPEGLASILVRFLLSLKQTNQLGITESSEPFLSVGSFGWSCGSFGASKALIPKRRMSGAWAWRATSKAAWRQEGNVGENTGNHGVYQNSGFPMFFLQKVCSVWENEKRRSFLFRALCFVLMKWRLMKRQEFPKISGDATCLPRKRWNNSHRVSLRNFWQMIKRSCLRSFCVDLGISHLLCGFSSFFLSMWSVRDGFEQFDLELRFVEDWSLFPGTEYLPKGPELKSMIEVRGFRVTWKHTEKRVNHHESPTKSAIKQADFLPVAGLCRHCAWVLCSAGKIGATDGMSHHQVRFGILAVDTHHQRLHHHAWSSEACKARRSFRSFVNVENGSKKSQPTA